MAKLKVGDMVHYAYQDKYEVKNAGVIIKVEEHFTTHPYTVKWNNIPLSEDGWLYSDENLRHFAEPNDILKDLVNG